MIKQVYLIDRSESLCEAWLAAVDGLPPFPTNVGDGTDEIARGINVDVHVGSIEDVLPRLAAGAFITAGNSFGIMDGGIDLAVRRLFPDVQAGVLQAVHERGGFVPVGDSVVVPTQRHWCPYLIYTPTMMVPELVHGYNAFLAFHNGLVRAQWLGLESVAASGFATATGGFTPEACAKQMRVAIDFLMMPPLPGDDNDGARYGHTFDKTRWMAASERYAKLQEVKH